VNIYRIIEDCEDFCIKANTMIDAINICRERYLDSVAHDDPDNFDKEDEIKYYNNNILQSCALIGELKN
jgi:hypothetical protein